MKAGDHFCVYCKNTHSGTYANSESVFCGDCNRAPLPWLKRIPPLEELEGQRTEEGLREPAHT